MKYTLEELAAFLEVVETRSISGAARRMGLSKSVVSKRLTDLERSLGVELLRRTTRLVAPSERGREFYQRAGEILRQLEAAVADLADGDGAELGGKLRVTAPMTFGTAYVGPILFRLAAEHPRLSLQLDLDDRALDLLGLGYDLAVRIGHLRDSALVARRLTSCRRIICCSPDYARLHGLPRSLADLAHHQAVGYANASAGEVWRFARDDAARAVVPPTRVVANNGEAIRDALIAGLGLAPLPAFVAVPALCDGRLIDAMPSARLEPYAICAVYPRRRHPPRALAAVIERLEGELRDAPWEKQLRAQRGTARA